MKYKNKFIFLIAFILLLILQFIELASADIDKTVLPNGLTVITKEDHDQPIVAVQIWVKAGSVDEREDNSGISHFIEHMLFKGSDNLKNREIAQTIEAKGGVINAATSKDFTYYHIVIPSEYLNLAVNVLGDVIMHANFPADEFEKERLVILQEIKRRQDNPLAQLWDLFNKNIYNNHPYSRNVIGPADVIEEMKRETLLEYYNKFYVPNNMALVVIGDFDTSSIISEAEIIFKDFKRKKIKHKKVKSIISSSSNIHEKRDIQQAYLLLGTLGPDVHHKDQYAMDILSYILGGGKTSRLYRKLLEDERLVYEIDASFLTLKAQSPFYIGAACEPAKIPLVKEAILKELALIKEEKVSEDELARAKTMIKSSYLLSKQTYAEQASTLGYYQTIDTYKFDQSYIKRIEAVTIEDILDVAEKYIDLDKLTSVIISPELKENPNE